MKSIPDHRSWVVSEISGKFHGELKVRRQIAVCEGFCVIRVRFSALNYKDALSASGNKGITKQYPHIPGIDAAGEVVYSPSGSFRENEKVIVTGYDLGMNTDGGWSEYVQVPEAWVVSLPDRLSLKEAALIGTAGLTAALSLRRLEHEGLGSGSRILITGATGGVGSLSLMLLSGLGYQCAAVTGKKDRSDYLKSIGAREVLMREEVEGWSSRPLNKGVWDGAIDTVGGAVLQGVLTALKPGACVAVCGLAGSAELKTSIYPFILRGNSILGVDSAEQKIQTKRALWGILAGAWRMEDTDRIQKIHQPKDINADVQSMLSGNSSGRTVYEW